MSPSMSLRLPAPPADDAAVRENVAAAPRSPAASRARDARLRAVVDGHFDFIGRSLRNLGVVDADVDDALQQVFLVVARRLDDVAEGAERSFLFQVAVRIASRMRRGRARRREIGEEVLVDHADAAAGPEAIADARRAHALLDELLEELDLELRTVFVLYEVEELTTAKIAALLELPVGTVASRLRRAREAFAAKAERLRLVRERREGGRR